MRSRSRAATRACRAPGWKGGMDWRAKPLEATRSEDAGASSFGALAVPSREEDIRFMIACSWPPRVTRCAIAFETGNGSRRTRGGRRQSTGNHRTASSKVGGRHTGQGPRVGSKRVGVWATLQGRGAFDVRGIDGRVGRVWGRGRVPPLAESRLGSKVASGVRGRIRGRGRVSGSRLEGGEGAGSLHSGEAPPPPAPRPEAAETTPPQDRKPNRPSAAFPGTLPRAWHALSLD